MKTKLKIKVILVFTLCSPHRGGPSGPMRPRPQGTPLSRATSEQIHGLKKAEVAEVTTYTAV